MNTVKTLVLVVLVCLTIDRLVNAHPTIPQHDGNWWRSMEVDHSNVGAAYAMYKAGYLAGVTDGLPTLGPHLLATSAIDPAVKAQILLAYRNTIDLTFFSGRWTYGQLVDGVDAFYQDFRHRRIVVPYALHIVLLQMAGAPQSDLDKMIAEYRESGTF